ncbi:pyridoxal phosphate-dependent decarboxylase family protein [Erythrobacter mangrovi]|uniref:Aspartate aminotransferase family protein n=1 Tax=Erythrobacter mangrovi TaxID=2739433 RepID=A0A7D4BX33_9SPHN|nr:aminotransferase class V-fold PLP-dependent enzyme [Erythrobacter mangrovi]QKG72327.1 aspartate aminotransferase family protein [Erythrobacter mangrovi]
MSADPDCFAANEALELAAQLALEYRSGAAALDPGAAPRAEASGFDIPLPRRGREARKVIAALDAAARPGLTGSTKPGFMGWVIGGSHPAGIAADWLAATWGQNACLYDSSPAAAQAEAASAAWLLDVLDLPREASVGFTTGATMAAFTALAAARLAVLERAGHDFETKGLFGCPEVAIYISDDGHVTNYSVLRYLGFGDEQIRRIPSLADGTFDCTALEQAMRSDRVEARIVIAQAGQIMSGGFDDFTRVSALCREFGAWLHVDGAFGLWVRASRRLRHIAHNIDLADSWSVDGHKWLQIPYDCGFAIVRDQRCHRRAMAMQAGYLPDMRDTRNNADFVPELSRRARGFAVWAVMQSMGRLGIERMVEEHCNATHLLAQSLRHLPGVDVVNTVYLNQLAVAFTHEDADLTEMVASHLNATGRYFVRTADWRGRKLLRFSITCGATTDTFIRSLVGDVERFWLDLARRAA